MSALHQASPWSAWQVEHRRDELLVFGISRVLLALGIAGVLWLPLPHSAGADAERRWAVASMSVLTLLIVAGDVWSVRMRTGAWRMRTAPRLPLLEGVLVATAIALTGGLESPLAPLVVLLALCWECRDGEVPSRGMAWLVGAGAGATYLVAALVALPEHASALTLGWMLERGVVLGLLAGALGQWRLSLLAGNRQALELRRAAASWRAEAVALERTRGELLAHVSHELITPLAAIRSSAELLGELTAGGGSVAHGQRVAEARERMLGAITRNTARLELSVQDLLELARLEEGRPRLRPAWHACGELLARVAEALEPLLVSERQEVRIVVAGPDVRVWGDSRRIERVLLNLLANAHKYAGAGATIEMRAAREGTGTRLEVADDGPGIAPEALARIFDRYYRAPGVPGQGSGLGLAIVRAEVELHGGRVWAEQAGGTGCRFVCVFPSPPASVARRAQVFEVSQ